MHRQIEWSTMRRSALEEFELRIGGLEFLDTGWIRNGYPGQRGTDSENEVVFWDEWFTYHWFMDFIRDEFQVNTLWRFVKELRRFSFFSEPKNDHQLAQCLAQAVLKGHMRVLRFGRDLYGRRDWNDPDYTPMVGLLQPVKPKEPKPEPPVRKVEDPYGPIRVRVVEDSTGKPIPNVKIGFFLNDLPPIYTNAEGIAETSNVLGRTYVAECRLGNLLPQTQVLDYVGEGETPIYPSEESSESDNSTEEYFGSSYPPPEFIIAHVKENKYIKWEMEYVHINEMRTVRVRKIKKRYSATIRLKEKTTEAKYRLFSSDGTYDQTKTAVRKKGELFILEFPDVNPKLEYSLEKIEIDDLYAIPELLFKNLSYHDIEGDGSADNDDDSQVDGSTITN